MVIALKLYINPSLVIMYKCKKIWRKNNTCVFVTRFNVKSVYINTRGIILRDIILRKRYYTKDIILRDIRDIK